MRISIDLPKPVGVQAYYTYETPIGEIMIASDGSYVTALRFAVPAGSEMKKAPDALTDGAARQLEDYFAGKRRMFDLPLRPFGTVFQRSVWEQLLAIPYGETRSYKQVAEMVGRPNACRAVGMANNRNPISIIIPCHRVIGSGGDLVGYGGGLEAKRALLELEKR